jgi:hypothetical protein
MTATFDHLDLRDLVTLLTEEEQQELRPVVLRLVSSHTQLVEESATGEPSAPRRPLSFAGTVHAGPDFASTSEDVLWRELGGRE